MESWLEPVHDAKTMRAADSWAIEERGIPSLDLMERAGTALAEACEARAGSGPVRIVCGKGNNGGDGIVAARVLASFGHAVEVLLLAPPGELSSDSAANLERFDGEPSRRRRAMGRRARPTRAALSTRSSAPGSPARRASRRARRSRRSMPAAHRSSPPTSPPGSTPRPARSTGLPSKPTRRFHSTPRSSAS